jgi:hypothetical protein
VRSQGNHEREMEAEIASPTFLSFRKNTIEYSEELQYPLLSPTMSGCRMLDGEWMNTSVMTPYLKAAMADANTTN